MFRLDPLCERAEAGSSIHKANCGLLAGATFSGDAGLDPTALSTNSWSAST